MTIIDAKPRFISLWRAECDRLRGTIDRQSKMLLAADAALIAARTERNMAQAELASELRAWRAKLVGLVFAALLCGYLIGRSFG